MKYVIARFYNHYRMWKDGHRTEDCRYISSVWELRGYLIDPDNIVLIPGWEELREADEIREWIDTNKRRWALQKGV